MQYFLLFLEGIITFISPCLLPMLPVYISYFASGENDNKKTLINSIGFVFGFTIVFVTMGAFSGTVGRLLRDYVTIVNIVAGVVVIIFGLSFMGVLNIKLLSMVRRRSFIRKKLDFFSAILFGIVFSIGWTPCVGAFLGSALMLAATRGTMLSGILMLLVFSLGLGIPFVMSALLIDKLKGTFDFIKKNYKIINILSGILLIMVGVLMATGLMGHFLSALSF